MAIYADNIGYNGGSDGKTSWLGIRNTAVVSSLLDFKRINADRLAAGATALAVSDAIAAMKLKAGTVVLLAGFEVVTADSGSGTKTMSLGDDRATIDDVDYWVAAADIKTTGFNTASTTTEATDDATTDTPKIFEEDGNLLLELANGVPTDAVISVFAIIADCSRSDEVVQRNYGD